MKRILFTSIILFCTAVVAFCQVSEDEKGMARVRKQQGFDIYIYCEPVADYEEIEEVGSTLGALAAAGDVNITIDQIVQSTINRAVRKNKKIQKDGGTQKIEAIIIYSNEKASGIRYVE